MPVPTTVALSSRPLEETLRAVAVAVLALALVAVSLVAAGASTATAAPLPPPRPVDVPFAFVENQGQVDPHVRYHAVGDGFTVFVTDDGIVVSSGRGRAGGQALELRFVGARADAVPGGRDVQPGVVNVLRGPQDRWRTGIATYDSIVYPELWPGIDMVLHGQTGKLKYEFVVRPGAEVDDIALRYVGSERLTIDRSGALTIETAAGTLQDSAPVTYQDVDGLRVPVASRFSLDGDVAGGYGFVVGAYDRDHVLVVDPALDFATFLGGSSDEDVHDMAVDADGNVVVVGSTQSLDFPTTPGAVSGGLAGGIMDAFVAVLDADGGGLVYATYLGGTPTPTRRGNTDQTEVARSVAVDSSGSAYVTGQTGSGDFPTTSGAVQGTLAVGEQQATDAFVAKLTPTGSLAYSTFLGGGLGADDGRAIAVDGTGRATVAGSTFAGDFPTTAGAFDRVHAGGEDVFVARLDASASSLDYSTLLGGDDNELSHGIAVDTAGSAYVSGATRSLDFPSTPGAFQSAHSGGEFAELFEGFVTKLSPDGSSLTYSTFLGGTEIDHGGEVTVGADGAASVLVATSSPTFPTTPGTFDTTFEGTSATALARLGPDGGDLVWSTFVPAGTGLRVLSDGSTWLGGRALAGAPTTPDAVQPANAGDGDGYVAHLDPSASQLLYASFFGGTGNEGITEIDVGPSGDVYIAGTTMSPDLPTTAGAFDRSWAGDASIFWGDGFVARFTTGAASPTPSDTTAPTVTITGPTAGGTVSGSVSVTAEATDDVGVTEVAVLVDGAVIGTDTTSPFAVTWDSTTVANGSHAVTATARDAAGNSGGAPPVTVTVQNATPSEPETVTFSGRVDRNRTVSHATTVGAGTVSLELDWSESRADLDLRVRDSSGHIVFADTGSSRPTRGSFSAAAGEYRFEVTNTSRRRTSYTLTVTHPPVSSTSTPEPEPAALSAVALSPESVTGGESATGSVTLTAAAPSGGAEVTLVSSDTAVATVPANVTVPAGDTSASFSVATSPRDSTASSTISASHGGVTATAVLQVTAAAGSTTDSVTIERAEYDGGELEVRASSSAGSTATLTVHVTSTGELIGTLSSGRGRFGWPTNPGEVTVRSSLGGSATSAVSSG